MCSNSIGSPKLFIKQTLRAPWAWSLTTITFLALGLGAPARSQEPPHPAESVTEAARNAREHQSNSTKHPKIVTNDDLGAQNPVPGTSASLPESSATSGPEVPKPPTGECDNPDAERLKSELLAAQAEQDKIRGELSYNPLTISGASVDMKNFKPGKSGFDFGSPPLLETKPLVPARIEEVSLDEKIASLTRALRIACESPKAAGIQTELDSAEQELKVLQREFDLDQNAYYSKTNYAADAAGKARLDAEAQQVQYLQSEVERLKGELSVAKPNQILD
ncbi:MAG TPA: hypothetical protein VJW94_17545 [Candidatus Acidoferrum sp.]|nr:hypothetical protein [Candidatus Acidoferrum sp.]